MRACVQRSLLVVVVLFVYFVSDMARVFRDSHQAEEEEAGVDTERERERGCYFRKGTVTKENRGEMLFTFAPSLRSLRHDPRPRKSKENTESIISVA